MIVQIEKICIYWSFGRIARRKLLLSKEHNNMTCVGTNDSWNNVLWMDEIKMELSGHNAQCRIWKTKKKHSILAQIPHTNYQAWWWRGGDLGILQSLSRPWSPLYSKILCAKVFQWSKVHQQICKLLIYTKGSTTPPPGDRHTQTHTHNFCQWLTLQGDQSWISLEVQLHQKVLICWFFFPLKRGKTNICIALPTVSGALPTV